MRQAKGLARSTDVARQLAVRRDHLRRFVVGNPIRVHLCDPWRKILSILLILSKRFV